MAKIVTITNPLTGQPAQVDQLDHTAQQIDDGLNIARGVSNPNLLDNWYFGNPVNQRGQTSYTGAGYGIDRWKPSNNKVCVLVKDGYIRAIMTDAGNAHWLSQIFPFKLSELDATHITVSALIRKSRSDLIVRVGCGGTENSVYTNDNTEWQLVSKTITNPVVSNTINITSDGGIVDGDYVDIKAVKLELGTQQTLAHQDENGNWVLNEIPDYGEQLARCQRYFQTFATESLRPTNALDFRPVMRATPALSTITVGGKTLYTASADL